MLGWCPWATGPLWRNMITVTDEFGTASSLALRVQRNSLHAQPIRCRRPLRSRPNPHHIDHRLFHSIHPQRLLNL
jgi:hypothetical protein